MDAIFDVSRGLIVIGLTLLLVLLRLDAERFGTAEYYESTRDGERPRVRRRLAWYGLGTALVIAIAWVSVLTVVGVASAAPEDAVQHLAGAGPQLAAALIAAAGCTSLLRRRDTFDLAPDGGLLP